MGTVNEQRHDRGQRRHDQYRWELTAELALSRLLPAATVNFTKAATVAGITNIGTLSTSGALTVSGNVTNGGFALLEPAICR